MEQLAGRDPHHRTRVDLEASVAHLLDSPPDHGTVELVLVRPSERHRVVLSEGWLDPVLGMQGDSWPARPWLRTPRGGPDTAAQLSVTNARVNALVAGGDARRTLSGDQLHVDLDLSVANLPVGRRIVVGEAVLEVTATPHLACAKYVGWYGADAARFVNGRLGRAHRWRGVYARVVRGGRVATADVVRLEPVLTAAGGEPLT